MTATSERPLMFRRPGPALLSQVPIADAPDLARDYQDSSLDEFLDLDLRDANLILEPSLYCDLHCSFCALPVTSRATLDWDRLSSTFQAFALCGIDRITLTGGEPGIFPQLARWLADLRRWGFSVDMLTHGLWAANDAYLNCLLDIGALRSVLVSLKALDVDTFQAVTGRRSPYGKQAQAFGNLARAVRNGRLERWTVQHVLTTDTLERMEDVSWLTGLDAAPSVIVSLVEPYLPQMRHLVPTPARLQSFIAHLDGALSSRGIVHHFEGFPLCMLGAARDRSLDISRQADARPRILIQPRSDADYVVAYSGYQRLRQFVKIEGCIDCAVAARCPGIHARLLPDWGRQALRPVCAESC